MFKRKCCVESKVEFIPYTPRFSEPPRERRTRFEGTWRVRTIMGDNFAFYASWPHVQHLRPFSNVMSTGTGEGKWFDRDAEVIKVGDLSRPGMFRIVPLVNVSSIEVEVNEITRFPSGPVFGFGKVDDEFSSLHAQGRKQPIDPCANCCVADGSQTPSH